MTITRAPAVAPSPAARPPRGFGRTANSLLAYTLAKGLQLSLYALIFPLYMYTLGYKQDTIGLVSALGAITTLVGAVPLGLLADRLGRARMFVWSAWLVPWPYLGMVLSPSLGVIIPSAMLANFFATVYWSTNAPLLVGAVRPDQRVRVFSMNAFFLTGVGTIGALIGGMIPPIAGFLLGESSAARTPLKIALAANVVVMRLGAIPLFGIRAMDGERGTREQAWKFRAGDLRLYGKLLSADALMSFGGGAVIGFLPLFFNLRYGLQSGVLGILFTATGALSGVASLASPLLARRFGDVRALVFAQAAIAPCIFLTALAPVLWIAIIFEALRNGLRGTLDPIYVPFAMTRVATAQRGALGGLYNVTWATGFSLGPLLSGWLQVRTGFGPAFTLGAVCYALAALAMWTFFRRSRPIADDSDAEPIAAAL